MSTNRMVRKTKLGWSEYLNVEISSSGKMNPEIWDDRFL